jgi:hypothetical protein
LGGTNLSKEESSPYIACEQDGELTPDIVSKLKKRKTGRIQKLKGDWCLLAGDPEDALT